MRKELMYEKSFFRWLAPFKLDYFKKSYFRCSRKIH